MKKRGTKTGTGYWQRLEARNRLRRQRSLIPLLSLVGLIIGGFAGYFLHDLASVAKSNTDVRVQVPEISGQQATSRRMSDQPAKGWEQYYRRPPNAELQTYDVPAPGTQKQVAESQIRFSICVTSVRINCVVDGDTIWYFGAKIRIADIDTPEISSPKCASEEALGQRAKHRLLDLLNAGPFQVTRTGDRDKDRYGRLLRVIMRDGQSLGMVLVAEGMARPWDGAKRPWC
jgi:endonuclease YncB( thermonuclease family)